MREFAKDTFKVGTHRRGVRLRCSVSLLAAGANFPGLLTVSDGPVVRPYLFSNSCYF